MTPTHPPEPAPSETAWEETEDAHLTFSETARFRFTAGNNNIPPEITVASPVFFTPSGAAAVWTSELSSPFWRESATKDQRVLHRHHKNPVDQPGVQHGLRGLRRAETGADDQVSEVAEGDVVGMTGWPPGGSFTLTDGYSVKDATAIEYTLDIDGLAGRSSYFFR